MDIDGENWASPPCVGCDEYRPGAVNGRLRIELWAPSQAVIGYPVDLVAWIDGRSTGSVWDFGDGTMVSNAPIVAHTWTAAGEYVLRISAYNESEPSGVSTAASIRVIPPPVHHVSLDNSMPVPPYASWETAATSIQDAVDSATLPGAIVLVTNGIYAARAQIVVAKPITLRSVNGPESTVIAGTGTDRCVFLTNRAILSGFTVSNGLAEEGAGVYCASPIEWVTNCILAGNSASSGGGGARNGMLFHCQLISNYASVGGGAYSSTLVHCTLRGNSAGYGGGASGATLTNCILEWNCTTNGFGGGAHGAALWNCTVRDNLAMWGGGAFSSTLNNCMVTCNAARAEGGGAYGGGY